MAFAVERFNTGVIADAGLRGSMEDTFIIVQDLNLDECMKISLFGVIDGHGGDWCAHYIRKNFETEFKNQITDPILGYKTYKGSINECITKAF